MMIINLQARLRVPGNRYASANVAHVGCHCATTDAS